ncbi:hypothetical protein IG197_27645 [Aminobacter sp. SR38]|uniref:hypothetical protein n=1 Tax=Aminobacter sp. SR38 TaxID=2774562 RepID=UPI00177CD497|nr:hypothetical protein [Aminobacter sp. SR38]QOF71470.1 hypothetical protein IG197_27645 [Aminobacter sp. SR38]
MITVATLFWQPNGASRNFSRCYSEEWVEKLYRGFRRNLTMPFRFVCFSDRPRRFAEPDIEQERIKAERPDYGTCIEPYRLGVPMILVGLDTVVTGNIDHLADYCLTGDRLALPRDPYKPAIACNGVGLVPAGHRDVAEQHRGENDMEWVRKFPHRFIDDLWPGHVVSFKGHVKRRGMADARIIYFHGLEKPHQLPHVDWIKEHWT